MRELTNTTKSYLLLYYLVWPFSALVIALKNYRFKWAVNVVWLFVAFYGYTMVIWGTGMDATREKKGLIELHAQKVGFSDIQSQLYAETDNGSETLDILNPLVHFLVSRVTDNVHVLFAVYGLIFGFFYSRNIWYLINRTDGLLTGIFVLLLFTFAFVNGFWNINGFRYWTATHIYLYGVFRYVFDKKLSGLVFVLSSCMVHFSYMLAIGIFFAYLFVGNWVTFYFVAFIISLTIKELNLEAVGDFLSANLPAVFNNRVSSYTGVEYAEKIADGKKEWNWYIVYSSLFSQWVIIIFVSIIFTIKRTYLNNKKNVLNNLLNYSLLFGSIANVVSLVPSGARFLVVSKLMFFAWIFLYLWTEKPDNHLIKFWKYFAVPSMLLYIVFSVRKSFDTVGIMTIFGNPFFATWFEETKPLIDYIKSVF